jgi:saxitoxin biosynthesis operon SxtJ-like protein
MNDKYRGSHEFLAREEELKASSDRGFGLVFAAFCAIVAALSLYTGSHRWPWWLAAAVIFALVAYVRPGVLAPLNRLWTKLGLLLFTVISPIVLGLIFFACVAPIGWIMRLTKKDPLRLRFEPEAGTYWIPREPPGPRPDTLKNQF